MPHKYLCYDVLLTISSEFSCSKWSAYSTWASYKSNYDTCYISLIKSLAASKQSLASFCFSILWRLLFICIECLVLKVSLLTFPIPVVKRDWICSERINLRWNSWVLGLVQEPLTLLSRTLMYYLNRTISSNNVILYKNKFRYSVI